MEKHEDDTEQARRISSTKLEKDHWSHMKRQGIKRRSILARTGQRRLQDIVGERRLRFAGHVMRMAPERPARHAIEWTPADRRRKRGRPKKTWRSTFRENLQARGVSWSEKKTMAADRVRWRNLLPIVPQGTGGSKC